MKAFIVSICLCLASLALQAQTPLQIVETIKKEIFKIQEPYIIHKAYHRDLSMPAASVSETKRYGIVVSVFDSGKIKSSAINLDDVAPSLNNIKIEDIAEIEIITADNPKMGIYGGGGDGHVIIYLKSHWNTLSEIAKKDIRRNSYRHYPPFK